MKIPILITFLLFSLIGQNVSAEKSVILSSAADRIVGYRAPVSIAGECKGSISPDHLAIVGGFKVEALKPLEAKELIEQELEELKKYALSADAKLILGERLRGMKENNPRRTNEKEELPFVLVQRVELEFPLSADPDQILDDILKLGFDKFGYQINFQYPNDRPSLVTFYRFSNLYNKIENVFADCKKDLTSKWCEERTTDPEKKFCKEALKSPGILRVQHGQLQSQSVIGENGNSSALTAYINNPGQIQLNGPKEIAGNLPLQLTGTLSLTGDAIASQ